MPTHLQVQHMRNLAAAAGESDSVEEARKYLGRFGLSGDLATRPIKTLSGGQVCIGHVCMRVCVCLCVYVCV